MGDHVSKTNTDKFTCLNISKKGLTLSYCYAVDCTIMVQLALGECIAVADEDCNTHANPFRRKCPEQLKNGTYYLKKTSLLSIFTHIIPFKRKFLKSHLTWFFYCTKLQVCNKEQRWSSGQALGLRSKRTGVRFPASPLEFSEIGYLLLPRRDMAEIPLKRRKSSIQPTNQQVCNMTLPKTCPFFQLY